MFLRKIYAANFQLQIGNLINTHRAEKILPKKIVFIWISLYAVQFLTAKNFLILM
jgi:hypothetical protein